jgi:hypothetical protein
MGKKKPGTITTDEPSADDVVKAKKKSLTQQAFEVVDQANLKEKWDNLTPEEKAKLTKQSSALKL